MILAYDSGSANLRDASGGSLKVESQGSSRNDTAKTFVGVFFPLQSWGSTSMTLSNFKHFPKAPLLNATVWLSFSLLNNSQQGLYPLTHKNFTHKTLQSSGHFQTKMLLPCPITSCFLLPHMWY